MASSEKKASLGPLVLIGLAIATVWATGAMIVYCQFIDWPTRGQFGDMFGGINALFSGLAFACLIYTVHLQRQELALQRRELELTRTELERTANAQEASEKALGKQAAALESAAKLNALSAVIGHYEVVIHEAKVRGSAAQIAAKQTKQVEYVQQLEQMLTTLMQAASAQVGAPNQP